MQYDLFISYCRRDNLENRITQLVDCIKSDFYEFSGNQLSVFIDTENIYGMEDWKIKILNSLRESKLMIACLSPEYIKSDYCQWEFNEYLKHEIDRMYFGDGIAPIYYIQVPGWETKEFDRQCSKWLADLRRRQVFDLRPWYNFGKDSLRDNFVQQQITRLKGQIKSRIDRSKLLALSIGNISGNTLHFFGRIKEFRLIQEAVAKNIAGVPIIVHGLEGIGKTSLVSTYAQVFSYEYGGGCWLINCEGLKDIQSAFISLQGINQLAFEFTENEKKSTQLQYVRVIRELKSLVDSHSPHQCLIVLDNIDMPELLEGSQSNLLPQDGWMVVVAISHMGPNELCGYLRERTFIPIDVLDEEDAVDIIASYQMNSEFSCKEEKEAASKIVQLLGSYPLAIEAVAIYFGRFVGEITFTDFLNQLNKNNKSKIFNIFNSKKMLNQGISPSTILRTTIEELTDHEKIALYFAALMPSDCIVIKWIKELVSVVFPKFGNEVKLGDFDPWIDVKMKLISYRLVHQISIKDNDDSLIFYGMHRFTQDIVLHLLENRFPAALSNLCKFILLRASEYESKISNCFQQWEIRALKYFGIYACKQGYMFGQYIALKTSTALLRIGEYESSTNLLCFAYDAFKNDKCLPHVDEEDYLNILAVNYLNMGSYSLAETHLLELKTLIITRNLGSRSLWQVSTNLGCLYRETCNLEKALPLLNDALDTSIRMFPVHSKENALSLINIGLLCQDLCQLDKAIDCFQKAVAIDIMIDDEYHLSTLQDIATLSEALRNQDREKEAETLIKKWLPQTDTWQLTNNPVRATLFTILARIIEDRGEYGQAREYLEKAKQIALNCYGESSLRLALYNNNLGMNSLSTGNYEQAIEEFQESIQMQSLSIPYSNFKIAHRYLNLGTAQILNTDFISAADSLQNAWKLCNSFKGILCGRILLVKILLSMLAKEPTQLYIGQLLTLFTMKPLYAPSINMRWSLNSILPRLFEKLNQTDVEVWSSLNDELTRLTFNMEIIVDSHFKDKKLYDLQIDWHDAVLHDII